MAKVVNVYKEPFTMYIGRKNPKFGAGSKFANKKCIGRDGTREEVIAWYREWLWKEIKSGNITIKELQSMKDEVFGCFCKPQQCHGDVLVAAVEWAMTKEV